MNQSKETKQQKHQQKKQPSATTTTNANTMLKDPPSSLSTAGAATATATRTSSGDGVASTNTSTDAVPTYHSSETSANYVLAKQLLNAGNFEDALSAIEQQLMETEKAVRRSTSRTTTDNSNNDNEQVVDVELHESLAPLHYLYGTTLLYSLEEAKDDGNDNTGGMAMMTEAAANAATTTTAGAGTTAGTNNINEHKAAVSQEETPAAGSADPINPSAHLPSSSDPAPQTDSNNEMAEDIQYAWENLEAARTIVVRMLTNTALDVSNTTNTKHSAGLKTPEVAKLQL